MIVGCVKEIKKHEYRVGMVPDSVRQFVARGHVVLIEKNAGDIAGFPDAEYVEAGAQIVDDAKDVWDKCEMMIKVKEPIEEEYQFFHEGLILYTYLHLAADPKLTEALIKSKVKAIAYETIQTANGMLPSLKPMSEIAGRMAIQEGAKYLEAPFGGRGVLLPGVPGVQRGKVVILGAGIVGSNALKLAVGMGAEVTVLDINLDRLTYLEDIYQGKITTLYSSPANIEKSIKNADVVIGAVLIPGAQAPKLLNREHLKMMKKGAVIVDVAVDQGGCCETTKATYHDEPIYDVDGVVHFCVANIPGAVPRTSTLALTNTTMDRGLILADLGLEEAIKQNPEIMSGLNVYDGKVTYDKVAEALDLQYVSPLKLIA